MPRSRNLNSTLKRLDRFPKLKIGVVGDFAADHYLVGITSRISREAPVLILRKKEESVLPGQAGNAAANLAALGVQCFAFGVTGDDLQGALLNDSLKNKGIDTSGIVTSGDSRTLVKTRVLAGAHHTTLQQMIRLDDDTGLSITSADRKELTRRLDDRLPDLDAIIVSDYGYGTVTPSVWKRLVAPNKAGKKRKKPILRVLDSRYDLKKYCGADIITPNETEVFGQLGITDFDRVDPAEAGSKLMKATSCKGLVMTRGNEGMLIFPPTGAPKALPIFGTDEVTDVTGAGDTVAAVITAMSAAGASLIDAACVANIAGGLVVMKRGAATITRDEIRHAALRKN